MTTKNDLANYNKNPVIYGMGFIGALIYFIINASGFWMGVIGVFKAIFWPAFLVYYSLEYLKV